MITYRVAFVGNEQEAYSKAQEFFFGQNTEKRKNFRIELSDISKFSDIDLRGMHFHSIVYDTGSIANPQKEHALSTVLSSRANIEDLKIFPLAKKEITAREADLESQRIQKFSGKENTKVLPINVTNEGNLKSVFQAIDIASVEYKSLAEEVLDRDQKEFELTSEALLDAMEEKSPVMAGHFRQVGVFTERIAIQLGMSQEEAKRMKYLGTMHDAGKLLIDEQLLNNEHMTMGNERAQMALHAELGNTVLPRDMFEVEEKGGIVGHHDRETDNKYAKIIAVSDCTDTMLAQRDYNNPKTPIEAARDIAKNMYPQPKRDQKGNILKDENGEVIYNPPQFDKAAGTAQILILANDLGSIGFDIRKMLEATKNNFNQAQDEILNKIFSEHEDEIGINYNAKEGDYSPSGYRLDQTRTC